MKVKTNELVGPALDWAVAKAAGYKILSILCGEIRIADRKDGLPWLYRPSTDGGQGIHIIDKAFIILTGWRAPTHDYRVAQIETNTQSFVATGPTTLIAATRCYVLSELGDEVDIPDSLLRYLT